MPKMTKRQTKTLADLESAEDRARAAIYAFAPSRDARLSECLALATDTARDAYRAAVESVVAYQSRMIADCRAYYDNCGAFRPN